MRQTPRNQRFDESRERLKTKLRAFEEIEGFPRKGKSKSARRKERNSEIRNQIYKGAQKKKLRVLRLR